MLSLSGTSSDPDVGSLIPESTLVAPYPLDLRNDLSLPQKEVEVLLNGGRRSLARTTAAVTEPGNRARGIGVDNQVGELEDIQGWRKRSPSA